jgi:hypothetical protein
MLPPLEEQGMADKLEPRCEFESWVVEHRLQSLSGNISSITDFVHVRLEVDIGFNEKNVIDCATQLYKYMAFKKALKVYLLSCSPHFPSLGAL